VTSRRSRRVARNGDKLRRIQSPKTATIVASVDEALGFFEERRAKKHKNKKNDNKMSSDMGSIPDPKRLCACFYGSHTVYTDQKHHKNITISLRHAILSK